MDPFSDGGAGRRASGSGASNRNKVLLIATVVLAAVALVIVFVSSGASDEGRDRAATDSQGGKAGQSGTETTESTGGTERTGPSAGDASTREDQENSQNENNASSDDGPGDSSIDVRKDSATSETVSAGDGPIPEKAQDPDVAPQSGEEVQRSHDDGEQAYVRAPEGGEEGEDGSTPAHENQPGSYDPLGRGAEVNGLTGTEKERARFAASNYVTYAYGYTGGDIVEYHDGLFGTMLEGEFQDSPGRAGIKSVEEDIKDGGRRSAAVLEEFDIKEPGSEEVKGVAYFTVGKEYGGGGVTGETTSYAQALNLQKAEAGWTVVAADELKEVSDG